MAKLQDRIDAEIANIQEVLKRLPPASKLSTINELELAGTASLLHNFYNGIENVLKQILASKNIKIPRGQNWHRDLLDIALDHKAINKALWSDLKQFLAFRHFFNHAYSFNLDDERMLPLIEQAPTLFSRFTKNVNAQIPQ